MKILLLCDAAMNPDAGGINQTLYNLFSFVQPENILCVTPVSELKMVMPSEPFAQRYVTFRFDLISLTHNRLSKYINPIINWFNFSYNNKFRSFKKLKRQIAIFKPDIIISCPNGPVGVFMHNKLLQGFKKVIPYFMDDWMCQTKRTWLGGNLSQLVKHVLSNNSWLMISHELCNILCERYKVTPGRLLIAQNPVDLSNAPDNIPTLNKKGYTLAYAGALWPMHFDSFKLVAESVFQLKKKLDINLILYSREQFWEWRRSELSCLGVVYGGNIPYKSIHEKLAQADALILTSSFLEQFSSHTKGSVQTKITDYLKAKRLIISCGPDYSANNNFLKKNDCGVCIETNDVSLATKRLEEILKDIHLYQPAITNGWNLLENEYTFSKVHQKLQEFLLQEITSC